MSAENIRNLVRALTKPYCGASFIYKKNEYIIWTAETIYCKFDNIEPGKGYAIYGCTKGISSKKANLIFHQWKLYRKHFKYSRLDSLKGIFYNILLNFKRLIKSSKFNSK